MTINFVIFSLKLTGGTRFVLENINGLAAKGHKINLIALGSPDDLNWIKLKADVFYVNRSLAEKAAGWVYRRVFGFQPWPEEETRKIIKLLPPADISVATISYSAFAVHRGGQGVPVHFFMHYEPLVREEGYKKKIIEESYFLPTKKIVNSSWLARMIKERTGQEPVGLVFPGVDHDIFYPRRDKREPLAKDRPVTIVSLAKYKWWKGLPDALRAVEILRKKGYQINFKTFGNNFNPADLPAEVRDIKFDFVGPKDKDDLALFYSQADILLSASFFESFPLPPLEAMACGTPVVTTRYGTEDYAFDRENALVVEPRQPELLAQAVSELIDNGPLYLKLSAAGLETAKKFNWQSSADQLETILLNNCEHKK